MSKETKLGLLPKNVAMSQKPESLIWGIESKDWWINGFGASREFIAFVDKNGEVNCTGIRVGSDEKIGLRLCVVFPGYQSFMQYGSVRFGKKDDQELVWSVKDRKKGLLLLESFNEDFACKPFEIGDRIQEIESNYFNQAELDCLINYLDYKRMSEAEQFQAILDAKRAHCSLLKIKTWENSVQVQRTPEDDMNKVVKELERRLELLYGYFVIHQDQLEIGKSCFMSDMEFLKIFKGETNDYKELLQKFVAHVNGKFRHFHRIRTITVHFREEWYIRLALEVEDVRRNYAK